MLGPAFRAVKANCVLVVLVAGLGVVSGCFWRSYPDRLRTHSELLVSFAHKARDLVAARRFTAENLPELTYPLERASAFAAQGRQHAATPPASLVAFEVLIDRYRAFVDLVDQMRRDRAGPDAARALDAPLLAIDAAASDVKVARDRER